ncbi:hypothetical protein L3Q82_004408 [Scortum barcoo]|uniref:Uncharacterized protein n=1 Tax=Scortum barcoo TaxID=214431 RepID=A0ACB8VK02_9TELE|nr:hypothetical protein L3Q82_004408 [Scortum barcoo]
MCLHVLCSPPLCCNPHPTSLYTLTFTKGLVGPMALPVSSLHCPLQTGLQPGGMAHWLLEEQSRIARDKQAQNERAASELEMERRNILNAMRYREPERVTTSGMGEKGQQSSSQAELERQQILNEMKKKTPLLTDSSWIRQRSSNVATTNNKDTDVPPMRRGESLDNLDASYNSWRSSWTPRSNSYVQNYTRPHSALSGSTSFYGGGPGAQRPGSSTLPSSYSMGSLRGGAGTPSSPWSRQSHSPSPSTPSPTTSPEPTSEAGAPQQRSSVSTASLTSEDQKPGLKSEYETSSSTVTPATYDSKLLDATERQDSMQPCYNQEQEHLRFLSVTLKSTPIYFGSST